MTADLRSCHHCLSCSDLSDSSCPRAPAASKYIHPPPPLWCQVPTRGICKSLHTPSSSCSYLSHVFLHQLRSNHSDEAGISPVSHSTGTQGFACARWPKQKHSFGRLNSKVHKSFRLWRETEGKVMCKLKIVCITEYMRIKEITNEDQCKGGWAGFHLLKPDFLSLSCLHSVTLSFAFSDANR